MLSATEKSLIDRLRDEIAESRRLQRKQAIALATTAERLSRVDERLGNLELHVRERACVIGLAQSTEQFSSLANQIELSAGGDGQPAGHIMMPPPVPPSAATRAACAAAICGDAGASMSPAQGVLHVGDASQAIYLPLACLADPYFDASRQRGSGGGGSGGGE
mmetsp:Transcript_41621/g.128367  ORF Transcript_41621/g.128367 Transcript_41621/m.128367 type:complete len:163 (-) Transcript_41621:57-545(-)